MVAAWLLRAFYRQHQHHYFPQLLLDVLRVLTLNTARNCLRKKQGHPYLSIPLINLSSSLGKTHRDWWNLPLLPLKTLLPQRSFWRRTSILYSQIRSHSQRRRNLETTLFYSPFQWQTTGKAPGMVLSWIGKPPSSPRYEIQDVSKTESQSCPYFRLWSCKSAREGKFWRGLKVRGRSEPSLSNSHGVCEPANVLDGQGDVHDRHKRTSSRNPKQVYAMKVIRKSDMLWNS